MRPITRTELDIMCSGGCEHPDCKQKHIPLEELYPNQLCHPGREIEVRYVPKEGNLYVQCKVCEQPILIVEVRDPV